MENGESLFLEIIGKLNAGDVLPHIVLVGSWVSPIYREYFDDDPEIPILRTSDVDFLIPELGRGRANAVKITELGISAQPLRFLSLAYKRSMSVSYHGYNIRVPEP